MLTKEQEILQAQKEVEQVLKAPKTASFLLQRFQQFNQLTAEHKLLVEGQKNKLPETQKRVYRERIWDLRGEMEGVQSMARAIKLGYEPYTIPSNYYPAEFDKQFNIVSKIIGNNKIARSVEAGLLATPVVLDVLINSLPYAGISIDIPLGMILGIGEWARTGWRTDSRASDTGLEFNAPVPAEVLTKYQKARDTKLFEKFLVASPDRELFREVPRTLFIEPVLVGYIPEKTNQSVIIGRNQQEVVKSRWQTNPGVDVRNGVGFLIAHWDLQKDRKATGLNF